MTILNNEEEFKWYKLKLDVRCNYDHDHVNAPDHYPCLVTSKFVDENNRPYTYVHSFQYKVDRICPCCGHTTEEYK